MLRRPALAAIAFYQRRLSPRKGYGCPHRLLHGGSGCSGVAARLIRRYGLWRGWRIMQKRFARCRAARQTLSAQRRYTPLAQRGDCEIPCDAPCCDTPELPRLPLLSTILDVLSDCVCTDGCESADNEEERERRRRINKAYNKDWS